MYKNVDPNTAFAGSAIAQGAGKVIDIDEWCPTTKERRWLLVAGSRHPPDAVILSQKGEREARSDAQGGWRSKSHHFTIFAST